MVSQNDLAPDTQRIVMQQIEPEMTFFFGHVLSQGAGKGAERSRGTYINGDGFLSLLIVYTEYIDNSIEYEKEQMKRIPQLEVSAVADDPTTVALRAQRSPAP